MSTPTETKTDFADENAEFAENAHQSGHPKPVEAGTKPERHDHKHGHHHGHDHEHENGQVSPTCVSGGCVDGSPVK